MKAIKLLETQHTKNATDSRYSNKTKRITKKSMTQPKFAYHTKSMISKRKKIIIRRNSQHRVI